MPQLDPTQVRQALDNGIAYLAAEVSNPFEKLALEGLRTVVDNTGLVTAVTAALNSVLAKIPG